MHVDSEAERGNTRELTGHHCTHFHHCVIEVGGAVRGQRGVGEAAGEHRWTGCGCDGGDGDGGGIDGVGRMEQGASPAVKSSVPRDCCG